MHDIVYGYMHQNMLDPLKLFHSSLEVTRMATATVLKKSQQVMRACLNDCLLTNMFQGSDIIFHTASILCTVKSRNHAPL